MNLITRTLFVFIIILFTGCGSSNSSDNTLDTSNNNITVGTIQSTDLSYININDNFDTFTVVAYPGSTGQQILLNIYNPSLASDSPSLWSLAIRTTSSDPLGVVMATDIEMKLFYNYVIRTDICCIGSRPYSDFDSADTSYIAVGGFLDFNSDYQGVFEVDFQQETFVGSGITTGPIVHVVGCWSVDLQNDIYGCTI